MRVLSSNTSKRAVLLTPAALAVCALLLSGLTGERVRHARAAQTPDAARVATVVLDDSAFYGEMPKGDLIAQTGGQAAAPPQGAAPPPATNQSPPGPRPQPQQVPLPAGAWLFNNSGLVMRSQAFVCAKADIPEAGTYHLFVRSHGGVGSSFRVTVGEKQPATVFGDEPLAWKAGGTFELKKGTVDVVLSRIVLGAGGVGSTFDALVLAKDAGFREEDLKPQNGSGRH